MIDDRVPPLPSDIPDPNLASTATSRTCIYVRLSLLDRDGASLAEVDIGVDSSRLT